MPDTTLAPFTSRELTDKLAAMHTDDGFIPLPINDMVAHSQTLAHAESLYAYTQEVGWIEHTSDWDWVIYLRTYAGISDEGWGIYFRRSSGDKITQPSQIAEF